MLMVAILTWGKDLLIRSAPDMDWIRRIKGRLGSETDIIVWDSAFLCPFRLDHAYKELLEDEVIEFIRGEAYPELVAEGRLKMKHGKYPQSIRGEDTLEAGQDKIKVS